ncbi:MAG: hypothetical protein WAK18_07970 [Nocardioidaceae bacterium]
MFTRVPTHRRPHATTNGSRRRVRVVVGVLLVFVTAAAVGLENMRDARLVDAARDWFGAPSAAGAADHVSVPPRPARPSARRWRGVLHALDLRREQAWENGHRRQLATVFVPGSAVLGRDVSRLTAYLRRGLCVSGVTMRYRHIEIVATGPGLVRLRVVDRLQATAAHEADGVASRALPTDRPSRHLITLTRTGVGWRIAEITWAAHRRPRPG